MSMKFVGQQGIGVFREGRNYVNCWSCFSKCNGIERYFTVEIYCHEGLKLLSNGNVVGT